MHPPLLDGPRRARSTAALLGLGALLLTSAACSADAGNGTISGTVVKMTGAGQGTQQVLTQGTVTITGDHASKTLSLDGQGLFSVVVPSGDYEVSATSPEATGLACRVSGGVHVMGGQTTNVEIVCQVQ